MIFVFSLLLVGFVAAALIGSQAYFRGEQTKPIHERNWRSEGFESLAVVFTGQATDYSNRVPAYGGDAFSSTVLSGK